MFENQDVKVGKKKCKCSFTLHAYGTEMTLESIASCNKKCSGVAKKVQLKGDSEQRSLKGDWTFDMKFTKGRVVLSKGSVVPADAGEGSGINFVLVCVFVRLCVCHNTNQQEN